MGIDKGSNKDVVCLPRQGEHVLPSSSLRAPVKGDRCYVGGWGALSSGGGVPSILQSVKGML